MGPPPVGSVRMFTPVSSSSCPSVGAYLNLPLQLYSVLLSLRRPMSPACQNNLPDARSTTTPGTIKSNAQNKHQFGSAGTMWKRFLGPVSPYTETWPNIGPIHPKPLEEKREGRLCPFMCPFHASLHVPLALVAPGPDPSGMLLFMCPWLWWLRDQIPPGCFPSCAPLCAPGSFGSGA